jgi:hypothetical protein
MCSSASVAVADAQPLALVHGLAGSAGCASKPCFKLGCPAFPAPAGNENHATFPMAISHDFIGEILQPYRAHSRYLKSARLTHFRDKAGAATTDAALIRAEGRFSIDESCYIDDTGHFNAVEFNICYNQLAYVMFGKCVAEGLMQRLRTEKVSVPTFSEFKRHQLPNMVIVNIESRYYRQLDSRDFTGTLQLDRISSVGGAWFFFTTMTFADPEGVKAKGSVVLAFNPDFNARAH